MFNGRISGPFAYECCRCQKMHVEGQTIYQTHHGFQSKHGTFRVSENVALRVMAPTLIEAVRSATTETA